jgi:hypothetical protein
MRKLSMHTVQVAIASTHKLDLLHSILTYMGLKVVTRNAMSAGGQCFRRTNSIGDATINATMISATNVSIISKNYDLLLILLS